MGWKLRAILFVPIGGKERDVRLKNVHPAVLVLRVFSHTTLLTFMAIF